MRLVFISLLVVVGLCTGCKPSTTGGSRAAQSERKPRVPGLPKPLPRPAEPPAAIHVANPSAAASTLSAYVSGGATPARALLVQLVTSVGSDLDATLVDYADMSRPWDAAFIEGQPIVYLPILPHRVDELAQVLEGRPSVGTFGAVQIDRSEGDVLPRLAWLDRQAAALTLANSLEGLATGRELAAAYGHEPLFVTFDATQLQAFTSEVPFTRLTLEGEGLHAFQATIDGVQFERPELAWVADGALSGMLAAPQIAAGITTKYAQHDEFVRSIINQATREVNRQSIFVRGVLEDMLRRGASVLRSWNGRVMAGVGPSGHLLLGLGTDDADRAQNAALHLMRGLLDNLSLARTFGLRVPNLRLSKAAAHGAGTPVHVISLAAAKSLLPAEAAPLLDARGDLRVAMAFSQRAGGAMLVAGPQSADVLVAWLEASAQATPAADSRADLVAATLAVKPQTLASALIDRSGRAALRLSADAPATRVVVRRSGRQWTMTLEGHAPQEPEPPQQRPGHRVRAR